VPSCAAGVHTINYLLQGPATSFPSILSSPTALAAMRTAVLGSLSLGSTSYPETSITVSVLPLPPKLASAASAVSESAPAAVRPTLFGRAIFKAKIADQPEGSLPPNLGFLLLASPALLIPGQPFGPGLTTQACDENGNVLNLIGALPASDDGTDVLQPRSAQTLPLLCNAQI
jgi:hypothetical protein